MIRNVAHRMNPVVEKIINEVEQRSGRPVLVCEDSNLTTLASITYARAGANAHILRYKPQPVDPSYHIAFQAGHALRFFSQPAEGRKDFSLPNVQRGEVMRRLQIPGTMPSKVQGMLIDGLLLQLRSMSTGFRVDEWLRKSYPELESLQVVSVRQQLADNSKTLSPQVRSMMPKKIVNCSTGMNGAYAFYWSRVLAEPQHWLPYKALGYENKVEELTRALTEISDEPNHDSSLVDQWALVLGLTGSYEWTPHYA